VIVGLDGSPSDRNTLSWALRIAEVARGPVCVVRATEPMSTGPSEAAVREEVAASGAPGAHITVVVEAADPVTALTRVADEQDASVVVVGSGGGHSRRVVLGHVPAELPFLADRPVAIVPSPDPDREELG
jgi:nucleotide-binding universal stress UspA family protein